ncbi:hypothetical protein IW262DRAFT_1302157 [Armillaria fumosa]|nr:hypothetical protein IW262DRAFT_1302157 [Armillaria fumosa]
MPNASGCRSYRRRNVCEQVSNTWCIFMQGKHEQLFHSPCCWSMKGRIHANVLQKENTNGYIDNAEQDHLYADLQGCSGETDSEAEKEMFRAKINSYSQYCTFNIYLHYYLLVLGCGPQCDLMLCDFFLMQLILLGTLPISSNKKYSDIFLNCRPYVITAISPNSSTIATSQIFVVTPPSNSGSSSSLPVPSDSVQISGPFVTDTLSSSTESIQTTQPFLHEVSTKFFNCPTEFKIDPSQNIHRHWSSNWIPSIITDHLWRGYILVYAQAPVTARPELEAPSIT